MQTHIVIIGAGPAGLTAAYLLSKENIPVTVLEADPTYVGGIAKTVEYKGYCFDIGGHRFFSKTKEVEELWSEILPHDMLNRPRSSRIFYRQQYFAYPLKAFDALKKLGVLESLLCVLSYCKAKLKPIKSPNNFTDWVSNHFGKRLYRIFFKTYTEKVWGMRCENISADWAAQRIKGLSLFSAVMNACFPKNIKRKNKKNIKTLIDTFRYPRKGPGMLWQACAEKIRAMGNQVCLDAEVKKCFYDATQARWEIYYANSKGLTQHVNATHIISSASLKSLILDYLSPVPNEQILTAASALKYRDFLIVVLILKETQQFSDNWIYVHDAKVDVARIQNFKSWSPEMVPNDHTCCYGMEYFCFKDDALWSASDDILIDKAKAEIVTLGLAKAADILEGCVVRQQKAYPVYDSNYQHHVECIKHELEDKFPTLYLVGRNGMHKYNNQDHAMMTAMLTVKNILARARLYDVWCVNQDAEYIEKGGVGMMNLASGLRDVPQKISD